MLVRAWWVVVGGLVGVRQGIRGVALDAGGEHGAAADRKVSALQTG